MRIAVAYNELRKESAPEPGFLSQEHAESLFRTIRKLGHDVIPVEVSGPVGQVAEHLTRCRPSLVFSVAEGPRSGWRQALYPALFDDLGLPFTGSPAQVLATSLDKNLTKLLLCRHGVLTPPWQFVRHVDEIDMASLALPAIIKPNFEGWSTGITQDSVVFSPQEAFRKVRYLLTRFPDGILIEEFIAGKDLSVGYLEAVENSYGGVLAPIEYIYPRSPADHAFAVLDYRLKNGEENAPVGRIHAQIDDTVSAAIRRAAMTAIGALGCCDMARADFRLTPSGTPYLLEVNAAPSLQPGRGMGAADPVPGEHALRNTADAVITSAARRQQH
ncbi:hypothetical protein I5Q34_08000 [Streptomyces sp. AV19]|uniref:D-alanine--D-alanine ligase family protein n=1 Tax=Streptomyces sp. AV19 TaxID=2793068 RepID=UPI0018FE5CBF|nr:hypothetical protein [Streptomyces sp. AV19]MBH1934238.1 hypothetical protein [Streptomyces sp. AV19]MDG4533453.1 hypothetical protein [Streptomyces sp. AV19]